jgi:hypothetical protein
MEAATVSSSVDRAEDNDDESESDMIVLERWWAKES